MAIKRVLTPGWERTTPLSAARLARTSSLRNRTRRRQSDRSSAGYDTLIGNGYQTSFDARLGTNNTLIGGTSGADIFTAQQDSSTAVRSEFCGLRHLDRKWLSNEF